MKKINWSLILWMFFVGVVFGQLIADYGEEAEVFTVTWYHFISATGLVVAPFYLGWTASNHYFGR